MSYDAETLRRIYERTDGHCHICGKKLSFVNYAVLGNRGCWEVEHSKAKALGGTGHLNNLFPACIDCNRAKGTDTSKDARSLHAMKRAPLSRERKQTIRDDNTVAGVGLGAIIGGLVGGPPGAIIGGALGGAIGHSSDPEDSK